MNRTRWLMALLAADMLWCGWHLSRWRRCPACQERHSSRDSCTPWRVTRDAG